MRTLLATLLAFTALAPAAVAQDPPVVTTGAAQAGTTTATLSGTIDPNGSPTEYQFEYGTTTAYQLKSPVQSIGGDGDQAVSATIVGLTPHTTYHYRRVAGDVKGADRTFTTTIAPVNPAAPQIYRLSAQDKTTS